MVLMDIKLPDMSGMKGLEVINIICLKQIYNVMSFEDDLHIYEAQKQEPQVI